VTAPGPGPPGSSAWLEVLDGGLLTTIQDAGRTGLAHLGVPPSGFLDAPAARLANRLVGNDEDAAVLEATVRGPTLRLGHLPPGASALTVAVTGAPAPVRINGRLAGQHCPLLLRLGQHVDVGRATAGVRSYVAVRGGLLADRVLGSRSTDLLSGLGPPPLAAGQQLAVGVATRPVPAADVVTAPGVPATALLAVYRGPSHEWFVPTALATLTSTAWTVSPTSSRIGVRLSGPQLARPDARELPPEGMVTGGLQVPPDGQPVLLLADHPTTGGYPVLAVVRERDLPLAAQAAPGTTVRFRVLPKTRLRG
jgi:biotin-dependent carboxylase-like uncharacterized protein